MNSLSRLLLAIVAIATLLVSTEAATPRRSTSTWNAPTGRKFGFTRKSSSRRTKPIFAVAEPQAASVEDLVDAVQHYDETDLESERSTKLVPASVHAAAVACVSAAAIGGARCAIEMIVD